MRRRLALPLALLLGLALAGNLAACGKKGPPKPPEDEPVIWPRTYPGM